MRNDYAITSLAFADACLSMIVLTELIRGRGLRGLYNPEIDC